MFEFLNKIGKKRKQDCLLLTEDNRILIIRPSVVKGYIVDEKTEEAWALFPDSRVRERNTAKLYEIITERDAAPISINGINYSRAVKEVISQIAQEHASEARAKVTRKASRHIIAETLQLLALIFGIVVVILIIFGLFSSGKLHLPFGGESIFGRFEGGL